MSINISIKPAAKTDIPILIKLQKNDGFIHQYYLTPERLERLFHRGEHFFLAMLDGVPAGFASVDFEIRARIHFLSVDEKFIRQGVGSCLMEVMKEKSKQYGYVRLGVYVEANSTLEYFLSKHGFNHVGYYKNRYGNGKDATIWEVEIVKII